MTTTSRAHALTRGTLGVAALSTLVLGLGAPAATASVPASVPASAPAAGPRLLVFAGGESAGVLVHQAADTKKLHGTGRAFKRFVGAQAARTVARSTCSDTSEVGILVEVMRTDGFAAGGVETCGGYQALWAVVDGSWRQVEATQDTWDCRVLTKYDVPSDVVGDSCFAYHGDHKEHPYHQD